MKLKEYFRHFMNLLSSWSKDGRGGFTRSYDDASFFSEFPLKDGEIERLRGIICAKYKLDRLVFLLTLLSLLLGAELVGIFDMLAQYDSWVELGVGLICYFVLCILFTFAASSFAVGYLMPVSIKIDGVNYVSEYWDLRYIDIFNEIPSEALDKLNMTEGAIRFFDNVCSLGRPFMSFEAQLLYESYSGLRNGRKDVFSE
ncbi:hypothetical protein QTV49_004272 [Vibrio vulnificus]|nr:hypothetical protein [Vibrio vulnificus]